MTQEINNRRIAFVTVTIPVALEADTPLEQADWWEKAALENFLDHPAIRAADTDCLDAYLDRIEWDVPPENESAQTKGPDHVDSN